MNIPIVIIAHNRPQAFHRLLKSLDKSIYNQKVDLIISIDGGDNKQVNRISKNFNWSFGCKTILKHEENLGLREHVLRCGNLSEHFDGIILLEDDLFVSPFFYEFAIDAYQFYKKDKKIFGISLYSERYNETAELPFFAIEDGSDVFFLQVACSWGQLIYSKQWKNFQTWYESNNSSLFSELHLPKNIQKWPQTSWKRFLIAYMVENDKYFVYPRRSFTTNFCERGVHHKGNNSVFQVELSYGVHDDFKYKSFESSIAVYDVYHELLESRIKTIDDSLKGVSLEIDLYGRKKISNCNKDYVLTTKEVTKPIEQFGRKLKPHELNITERINGNEISLSYKNNVVFSSISENSYKDILYFYNLKKRVIKKIIGLDQ